MKKLSILCIALAALMLCSCGSTEVVDNTTPVEEEEEVATATPTTLAGEWATVNFEKDGAKLDVVKSTLEIAKSDKKGVYSFTGNSGVNRYFGDVEISGDNYNAHNNFSSTKMMGREAEQSFEDAFITCLLTADKITISADDVLTVSSSSDNSKLVFNRVAKD